jgi:hypothetical protein
MSTFLFIFLSKTKTVAAFLRLELALYVATAVATALANQFSSSLCCISRRPCSANIPPRQDSTPIESCRVVCLAKTRLLTNTPFLSLSFIF